MPILGTHGLAYCLPGLKKPQLPLLSVYQVHLVFKGAQLHETSGWFHSTVQLAFRT